ncbi:RNA polymerase sigma factor [Flavivirga spongiicola]|uniref:Sigma-70 family RNA polymerase sigma factor n=1 Tax=Flavivirga spongiicola TaxID=421621 RepID=A0ABU7XRS4_9FLAO|nr:sigma-70 family RNA polymerase sigma factor [Flavivirga sp. MEBiC05379]MDO5978471.1 sigma-70 family RNA polymerase sigma factor [Flavivirga sp. MEBiC05379]
MPAQNENFLKIIHKHQALIHKVCNIYRDSKEDKEDLFQEITYQLFRAYPKFEGRSKVTTWMYRIALNTAMASFRKARIIISKVKEIPELPLEEKHESINRERLFSGIRQLDDAEKAIISLYLDGVDHSEIADIMGITKNNVGVRLNRIKNKLKTLIK